MEGLLKFLDNLVTTGGISSFWLATCLGIGGFGFLFFYMAKSLTPLISYFKQPNNGVSKEELASVKIALQDDNKYILKLLDDVNDHLKSIESGNDTAIEISKQIENKLNNVADRCDEIHDFHSDEIRSTISIQRDLSSLVSDTKNQYSEINRQVQALQKDLASLHGTIIGLNTQRTRLK